MEEEIIKGVKGIEWQLKALGLELDTWAKDAIEMVLRQVYNRAYNDGHSAALKEILKIFEPKVE